MKIVPVKDGWIEIHLTEGDPNRHFAAVKLSLYPARSTFTGRISWILRTIYYRWRARLWLWWNLRDATLTVEFVDDEETSEAP